MALLIFYLSPQKAVDNGNSDVRVRVRGLGPGRMVSDTPFIWFANLNVLVVPVTKLIESLSFLNCQVTFSSSFR